MSLLNSPGENKLASPTGSWRFIIGAVLIGAAVLYLVITATRSSAQYYLTIEELLAQPKTGIQQQVRISGAVIGKSIEASRDPIGVRFILAQIPGDQAEIEQMGGIAAVIHQAVTNPNTPQLSVSYDGVKPDLLKNEAQAIVTGTLGEDGIFYADELLLKCPTRYEEANPDPKK